MRSRLAVHWVAEHMDTECIREFHPRSIKIVNPDYERCRRAYELVPDALFVLRDHPLSEQHDDMFRDPEGTGRRHAEEWAAHVQQWAPMIPRNQIVVLGINEPEVWGRKEEVPDPDNEGQTKEVHIDGIGPAVRYTVAFLDRCRELDLTAGALNLSVGWPADHGYKDSPPNWTPYEPVRQAIVRGNHYLILHEYFDHNGPGHMWRWWAGRYLQCPWQVQIIIGECGLDEYVGNGGVGIESRGWMAHVTPEAYMAQLAWYDHQLMQDARIHSAQIFTWDFAAPWATFDVRPIRQQLVDYANNVLQEPGPGPNPEPDTLDDMLRTEFGAAYSDLRSSLEQHATKRYEIRSEDAVRYAVLHHTTGNPGVITWQGIASYHVNDPDHQWPGIGYHIGIAPDGRVAYLGDIATTRYHAGSVNPTTVGLACLGDYDKQECSSAMLAAIERVCAVLARYLERELPLVGHYEVDAATVCPGRYLREWLHPMTTPANVAEAVRLHAWDATGVRYNPEAALYKYARANQLGRPVTNEYDLEADGKMYRGQGYETGIVYAQVDQWDRVMCVEWL